MVCRTCIPYVNKYCIFKEEIGQATSTLKPTTIKDLNNEYEAILKELSAYDITKGDLEKHM